MPVTFAAPIRSLRDFYAFEAHVRTANAARGRDVPPAWYAFPVFYFGNPTTITFGNGTLVRPAYTQALDYELEIAALVGRAGRDIAPEDAESFLVGYTVMNDWSARDVQRQEMSVGLGPAKGKDFATALGTFWTTPDELADRRTDRPGVYDLTMTAHVNGVERSRGNWRDIHWSFGEMIARASQGVTLHPGEVIGSGTVGTGCLLELTGGQGGWLCPGDTVTLTIERLGSLTHTICDDEVHP
jgi:fumarylacetoacetate (FAA) hydrolase